MAVICEKIIDYMNEIAPEYLAEPWDNVGLLVGDKKSEIEKVLVALDAIDDVIDEAIDIGANLILTHHPISLNAVKKVNSDTIGGKVYKLIKNNISVYSAHTNFDVAFGGTNDILAEKLGIKDLDVLEKTYTLNTESGVRNYGIGRIGTLETEKSFLDYIADVKKVLGLSYVNIVGNTSKSIKKVAVCSGSGSSYLETAFKLGADLYISGDVKYHDAQNAKEIGICWIDVTHYASENIAIPVLKQYLENKSKSENWNIEVFKSNIDGQPFSTI